MSLDIKKAFLVYIVKKACVKLVLAMRKILKWMKSRN